MPRTLIPQLFENPEGGKTAPRQEEATESTLSSTWVMGGKNQKPHPKPDRTEQIGEIWKKLESLDLSLYSHSYRWDAMYAKTLGWLNKMKDQMSQVHSFQKGLKDKIVKECDDLKQELELIKSSIQEGRRQISGISAKCDDQGTASTVTTESLKQKISENEYLIYQLKEEIRLARKDLNILMCKKNH